MEVTEIKVFPVREEKLKAFVSIVIDDCFMVNDIKVIRGKDDLFISMPSRRKKNGKFKDVAHPLNNDTRQMIEGLVLDEYRRAIGETAAVEPVAEAVADEASEVGTLGVEAPAVESQPEEPPVIEVPVVEVPAVTEPTVEERPEEAAPAPQQVEEPADSSEEENKSLEEVTELHLRDSFWTT